jgi:8-oxo-dGTP diphosphatase
MSLAHEPLVELRCVVAVFRRDAVLLLQRHDHGDWVLPDEFEASARLSGERDRRPAWVSWDYLQGLTVRPPISGFLPELAFRGGAHARPQGDVWRPQWGDP